MDKLLLLIAGAFFAVIFMGCQPKPAGGEITRNYWHLTEIKDGHKIITPGGSETYSLIFGNGSISGDAACNRYNANYSTDGTGLSVSAIATTKMMCDDINTENVYLNLLKNTHSYTCTPEQLILFSENGMLTFSPMQEEEVKELRYKEGIGKLVALFPSMPADKSLHLYPIIRVDRPGNYPFKGTLVDVGLYKFFDAETSEIWNSTGGDVQAIGQFGGFYLARVPGRYVSSDIALFSLKGDLLQRKETIAWAWCDEGWCNQQDAWLQDIDQDGDIDIVQHYTLTDDNGKIQDERIIVLVQSEQGEFNPATDIKVDKSEFKMAAI